MAKRKAIDIYCDQVEEIKKRISSIDYLLENQCLPSQQQNIEAICLQFRKILEFIALGSLVANKEEYDAANTEIKNFTHAHVLIKQLERVNPDFFPIAKLLVPNDAGGKQFVVVKDALTKKDFIKIYDACNKQLHARNPFKDKLSIAYYQKNIAAWRKMVFNLINSHQIKLTGQKEFWLVVMNDQDLNVAYSVWQPVDDKGKMRADNLH